MYIKHKANFMIEKPDKMQGKSFVVIGGDLQLVNSIEKLLFFAGASVKASILGSSGISAARDVRPDILIIEDTATDIETREVIKTLQLDELTKNIPTIIIAVEDSFDELKKLYAYGKQTYLAKEKFTTSQLISSINEILYNYQVSSKKDIFDFSESENNILNSKAAQHIKLMIIEDDSLLRNLLSLRLKDSGMKFDFCHSGNEAVSRIISFKPSIIILDLMLPGKDGLEVLSDIRNNLEIGDTPVIIFSNRDGGNEREIASSLGVDDFLIKATTDLNKLIKLVIKKAKIT